MDQFMMTPSSHLARPNLQKGRGTLTAQLVSYLRGMITAHKLRAGDRLPPSRDLAREWGVARGTLVEAIEILCSEELLISRQGAGVFVSGQAERTPSAGFVVADSVVALPRKIPEPRMDQIRAARTDFRPCRPSVEKFPFAVWRRLVADAAARAPSPDVADIQGAASLRAEISDYLRRARSLTVPSDKVFVSMGIVHAVHLLSRLYLKPGSKVVMEEPGYPLVRQIFELAGAEILPCPVDEDGLVVEALPDEGRDVAFVYVTPSHQFPFGGRLSAARRSALIEWAMTHGAIVLEDDYDGEFRYDVPPLPPLAALPNECVVYLGTFSKTLFPDLRVGYVAAQAPIIEALKNYRAIHEYGVGTTLQLALADFLASGQFDRHIARMSKLYRQKRNCLALALKEQGVPGNLAGLQSGLHSVLLFDPALDAEAVSGRAEKAGLLVPPISRYSLTPRRAPNGLVIGYAASSPGEILDGVSMLKEACQGE